MKFLQLYDSIPADQPDKRFDALYRALQTDWRNLFGELRRDRPIIGDRKLTLVTRWSDVIHVLSRPEAFTVAVYRSKMDPSVGSFMLARDDTELNWHDKSLMRSLLRWEDLEQVSRLARRIARESLDRFDTTVELVSAVARLVPLRIVQDYMGFRGPDDETMLAWSRATQADMFRNTLGDPSVHAANIAAGEAMRAHLAAYVQTAPAAGDTPVDRLLRLQRTGAAGMSDDRVVSNICGLLVGAIETTQQAIVQATEYLLKHPAHANEARAAVRDGFAARASAIVWEALRFNPVATLVPRLCERSVRLGAGTNYEQDITPGTVVAACLGSAMFDEAAVREPDSFDPDRPTDIYMHLGFGHHECLGKHVAMAMVPGAVLEILLTPGVALIPGPGGFVDFQNGPFPERFVVTLNGRPPARPRRPRRQSS